MSPLLIDLLLRSSLMLAMLWLAFAAVGRAGGSAAMRHAVLMAGLGALLLIPALAVLLPPLPLPILPAAPVAQGPMVAGAIAASAAPAPNGPDLLLVAYLAVALLLLGRIVVGQVLLEGLWRSARPADAGWEALLDETKKALGTRRPVSLRLAPGPAMPMTWGTLRPRLLVPADARGWSEEQRRIVLLHEIAHVARGDSFSRTAAAVVCALYWFHPLAWLACKRMRLEQEHACDDLVLSLGTEAGRYARSLVDIARCMVPPVSAVAMVRPSDLELRVTAIARTRPRARASAGFIAGLGASGLAAAAIVAIVVPVAPLATVTFARTPAPAVAQPHLAQAEPTSPAAARRPQMPFVLAASEAAPEPSPQDSYAADLARYERESAEYATNLRRYSAELNQYRVRTERYGRELEVYRADNVEYQRKVQAYHARVAEIGPNPPPNITWPTFPTAPTAPTYPTAPTAPTAPTHPVEPPSN